MAVKFFGNNLDRSFGFDLNQTKEKYNIISLNPRSLSDGSKIVDQSGSPIVEFDGLLSDRKKPIFTSEKQMITTWREMGAHPIIDKAVSEIADSCIIFDDDNPPITINLDDLEISSKLKETISDEFWNIYKVVDFDQYGYELFKQWYVDGKLYNQILIDSDNPKKGIQGIRNIDPRQIQKLSMIKNMEKIQNIPIINENNIDKFYVYNPSGFITDINLALGLIIHTDTISYVHSGISDEYNTFIYSNLYKAIKSLNQLNSVEDSIVVYRLSRASEKRINYIDVGIASNKKAKEYLQMIKNQNRNKINYNSATGTLDDERKILSIQDDLWIARKGGNNSTEVDTLSGGENLNNLDDLDYLLKKLYKSLNVPITRMDQSEGNAFSRGTEISRDEKNFSRFNGRLKNRFSKFFDDLLKTQLILKNIIKPEEWPELREGIKYKYAQDETFAELTDLEIQTQRINMVDSLSNYVGKYYSHKEIRKEILKQSDLDIERIDEQIEEEKKSGVHDSDDDENDNYDYK